MRKTGSSFLDLTFVPLLEAIKDKLPKVEGYIVMTDREHMPETSLDNVMCYEDLLAAEPDEIDWPEFDERTASSMCYTSGTTGNPKGALYSHRSTVLHTMFIVSADVFDLSCKSVIMPATPMFHVYAWGTPYAAAMVGCKFVMPGPAYDGASIYDLLDTEKATMAVGVPTVWMMLLDYVKKEGKSFPHLEATGIGGSAVPRSMIDTFEEDYDVRVFHAWGMTEMSPVGTTAQFNARTAALPAEERRQYQAKQGRTVCGVEMKIIDDDGNELPRDGEAFGEVAVRGPWVISAYYKDEEATASQFTDDGWFLTGDVATLDAGRLHADRRPLQGRDQVGRRMDLVDRPGERRGRPPGRHGGRRDRHAPSQMGRTAVARGGQGRGRGCLEGRHDRLSRRQGRQMVAAGRRRLRRRIAAHRDRKDRQAHLARPVQGLHTSHRLNAVAAGISSERTTWISIIRTR